MRAAGIEPPPVRQRDLGGGAWVGGVDFLYPGRRLVVELDGSSGTGRPEVVAGLRRVAA